MNLLRTFTLSAMLMSAASGMALAADAAPSYTIVKQVALGGPDKWDFLDFDPVSKHVLISHGTEVTVVDAKTGAVVGHVTGMDTSHGMAVAPELGRGFADSSNSKTVTIFDLKTLAVLGTVPAGTDSDALAYDPVTKRVFVMDADGAAFTTIDAAAGKFLSTTPLKGEPESAVVDDAGHLFINLASTGELARVNTSSLNIEARWPLPGCESPHGLSMDARTRRLFVSCVNDKLQVVSSEDGHLVATFPIGAGTDADGFDPVRHVIFSANADGTLSVIREKSADSFELEPAISTALGARTMTVDPATGRVYLVTADVAGQAPPKKAGGKPRVTFVPGSVKLLMLDPKP